MEQYDNSASWHCQLSSVNKKIALLLAQCQLSTIISFVWHCQHSSVNKAVRM
jgi:hypothetical protein